MNERYRLPDGWEWTTLGMLGEYINGRAFNDNDWSRRGTPIIRIQNLTGTSDTFNYYEGEIEDKYIVQPGELLVAWSATLGAYLWNGPKAYLNQHIFKVVSYIDRTFHYYLVQSIIEELYRNAHGSGMVHVTRGKFEAIPISLPPLQEQHRIVAAIEEKFTQLDATIATLRKDREKLKQARTSLLKAAVEGTLTQKWREQHPDVEPAEDLLARILHERREKWETAQLARMHERGIVPER